MWSGCVLVLVSATSLSALATAQAPAPAQEPAPAQAARRPCDNRCSPTPTAKRSRNRFEPPTPLRRHPGGERATTRSKVWRGNERTDTAFAVYCGSRFQSSHVCSKVRTTRRRRFLILIPNGKVD